MLERSAFFAAQVSLALWAFAIGWAIVTWIWQKGTKLYEQHVVTNWPTMGTPKGKTIAFAAIVIVPFLALAALSAMGY